MAEKCGSCKYFSEENPSNWCIRHYFSVKKNDDACGSFKKKFAKLPDEYIPDEEDFPLATDEGYIYAGES